MDRLRDKILCNPTVKLTKGEIYPSIGIDKITSGYKYVSNVDSEPYSGQSCSKFCKGDTIMARITPCLENGKIAQYNLDSELAMGSTELFVFRGIKDVSDNDYIYYLTSTDYVRNSAVNSMTGASGRQRADIKFIGKLKWDFPEYDIQCQIGKILSNYDDLIEENNRKIEILQEMAEELYKEWFVRRKNPTWATLKLKQFGYDIESGYRPKGGIDDSLLSGVPSLGAEVIDKLGVFDYSNTKLVSNVFYNKMKRGTGKDKDILLYKDGAYIGKVTLFMDKFPYEKYAVNEHVFLMRAKNEIYQYFLYFTLNQPQYFTTMQNLNRNAAQPGLTGKDLDIIKICKPDKHIITTFNSAVEPMLHNIFSLAKQNNILKQQRDLLLPRLMSGKLEVKGDAHA